MYGSLINSFVTGQLSVRRKESQKTVDSATAGATTTAIRSTIETVIQGPENRIQAVNFKCFAVPLLNEFYSVQPIVK